MAKGRLEEASVAELLWTACEFTAEIANHIDDALDPDDLDTTLDASEEESYEAAAQVFGPIFDGVYALRASVPGSIADIKLKVRFPSFSGRTVGYRWSLETAVTALDAIAAGTSKHKGSEGGAEFAEKASELAAELKEAKLPSEQR